MFKILFLFKEFCRIQNWVLIRIKDRCYKIVLKGEKLLQLLNTWSLPTLSKNPQPSYSLPPEQLLLQVWRCWYSGRVQNAELGYSMCGWAGTYRHLAEIREVILLWAEELFTHICSAFEWGSEIAHPHVWKSIGRALYWIISCICNPPMFSHCCVYSFPFWSKSILQEKQNNFTVFSWIY